MAAPLVDISILGDKALARKLAALTGKEQARAVRNSLKKEVTRVKRAVVKKIAGGHFKEPTGRLLAAIKATPTKAASMKTLRNGYLAAVWSWPRNQTKRDAIKALAIEYGFAKRGGGNVPANSYIRSTVDEGKSQSFLFLRSEIGKQIERIFRKRK